ncbi:MAG: sulfate permease [Proteobacteria bacterium]|nr:sulfate permease [Pseudomonadota bacterium]
MNSEPKTGQPPKNYRFDRMEIAGSLGDLGTLLPLAASMIVLNGLHATNVFIMAGLFYILAGVYFRVPIAVQPMKVIAAYAIGMGLEPVQISSAGLCMGVLILFLGVTNLIGIIRKYTPKSAIRGIQLALGVVLIQKGLGLMIKPDLSLVVQSIGPVSTGIVLGAVGLVLTLFFLNNKKLPAGILIVLFGIAFGLLFGQSNETMPTAIGIHLPGPLPYGWPSLSDFLIVLPLAVLPQLPMTIGNAIISNTDLTHEYFPETGTRVTNRSSSISQGIANIVSFFLGGMPMCHGAGGLAAHYRFGARTAGSNLIIGITMVFLALIFGENIVFALSLMPLSILGVLLVFAGLQLALMIQDLQDRQDFFTAILMLGLALSFNLAVAFIAGITLAYMLKSSRINV